MNRTEWRVLILLVISVFVNYVDRGNLSIAAPLLTKELNLNPEQMGILLSAFFGTYALMQLFGIAGWLAEKFDVTLVLAWGLIAWSAATALTGLAYSFETLLIMRLVLGVGESVAYPCYSLILARYFPEQHRGIANSLIDAGSKLGPALGTLVGGMLIAGLGWRELFVVLGASAIFWLIPWLAWRPKRPTAAMENAGPPPPTRAILGNRSAWGSFFGLFCANYYWYFLLTWLPMYLVQERGFSITGMAVIGSISYAAIASTTVTAGWLSDRWVRAGWSVTRVRKGMAVFGLTSAAVIILPVAGTQDNTMGIALLIAACMGYGVFTSNHWAITQTLAGPCAAGRWTSLQNGVGNLAGIAAPWFTGAVVNRTGKFELGFAAAAAVALIGAAMYAFVIGKVEQVDFDSPKSAAAAL